MKFIIFYAFVCTATSAADTKTNLRKPVVEPEVFYGKLKKTTCRDGSQCSSDKDCKKRGLNSKCKERDGNSYGLEPQKRHQPFSSNGKLKKTTCRDGSKCSSDKDCEKRGLNSKCKERDGYGIESQIFLEGKTTCRDGSKCNSDKDCAKRGLNSSCKERNGDGVETQVFLEGRTTCCDGSKCSSDKDCAKRGLNSSCKERDGQGPVWQMLEIMDTVYV